MQLEWAGRRLTMAVYSADRLQPRLPEDLVACPDRRVDAAEAGDFVNWAGGPLAPLVPRPRDEKTEPRVAIRGGRDWEEVVTVIEFLGPEDKAGGRTRPLPPLADWLAGGRRKSRGDRPDPRRAPADDRRATARRRTDLRRHRLAGGSAEAGDVLGDRPAFAAAHDPRAAAARRGGPGPRTSARRRSVPPQRGPFINWTHAPPPSTPPLSADDAAWARGTYRTPPARARPRPPAAGG